MGKCKDKQRKSCNIETNCKHFEGGYGRLPLSNVYTCHGFFQRTHKFEKVDFRTLFHKFTQRFVNKRFSNPWKPTINRILETPKTILCNFRRSSLFATRFKEQSFKTINESLDEKVGPETMRHV